MPKPRVTHPDRPNIAAAVGHELARQRRAGIPRPGRMGEPVAPETLAYLAGVIDSDGSISVRRSTYAQRVRGDSAGPIYSERVTVKQVTPEAIDLLKETFGGYRFTADPSAKRGRALHGWEVTDRSAADTLRDLLPFLRIKRAQAANCLRLRELKEQSRVERVAVGRGHVGASARTSDMSADMEGCYLRSRELNKVGV
jgi:hypothetical protein